ncbi:universal stress protein [Streptomyces sp. PSKA54]|uniref:Universal stress protein n=1 Tax=Streptomyces himalayensis subsp. aureolus TaxID=2758039 RepID=A0A7W2D1V7_9ACTN|nr:universal stress protein [Streptomyces himalayensis]MBA4863240.1 universal stress protein [Streptomyces himalayensis subsp. aureolus]
MLDPRAVAAGLDGSPESLAAAEWAAREAQRRALPLRLVHGWIWQAHDMPAPADLEAQKQWTRDMLAGAEQHLRARHPGLPITTEELSGAASEALADHAEHAEMLALGSSGHGAVAGFVLGSVGLRVLARAKGPVVMVRANEQSAAEHDRDEVVVGVQDLADPAGQLLDFAFATAAARGATLRAVHAWRLRPVYGYGESAEEMSAGGTEGVPAQKERALSEALEPWRKKYPQVNVEQTVDLAYPSGVVLDAAARAGLVVVGRRMRRLHLGMRLGAVAHAVLHHAAAPVAVVPHA